jgi:hypothetical protein
MLVKASKFEGMMASNGYGAFGTLDYDDAGNVVLRTTDVRSADVSGSVRVYFDSKREQVVTGRRFDPMGSGLVLMRPGTFYRIQTQVEILEPLPPGIRIMPVLSQDVADFMTITSGPMLEGFVGPVFFTIQPYRKVEIEKMTSLASLVFFQDGSLDAGEDEGSSQAGTTRKKRNSNRSKTMSEVALDVTEDEESSR